jgi:hypothetical protein
MRMSKKVTVTYTVTYDLRSGKIAKEYQEYLDDYKDTKGNRVWFVIDRFIGHHNLWLFDKKAKLKIQESK